MPPPPTPAAPAPGRAPDAGASRDAGLRPDAGSRADAGASADGGSRPDAGSTPKKLLQLTFDDGPLDDTIVRGGSVAALNRILAELKARGVKAAFFVLGQEVQTKPSAVQLILDGDHVVGNHAVTHLGKSGGDTDKLLLTTAGQKTIQDEFEKTHDVVAKFVTMKHWRAPRLEGIDGIWKIFQASPKLKGYFSHSDSHVDSLDSQRVAAKEQMLADFLSSQAEIGLKRADLGSRKSVRVLFHVKNSTAESLNYVLEGLLKDGYALTDFEQDS